MKLLVYGATRGYVGDRSAELILEYERLLVGRRTADALTLRVIAEAAEQSDDKPPIEEGNRPTTSTSVATRARRSSSTSPCSAARP